MPKTRRSRAMLPCRKCGGRPRMQNPKELLCSVQCSKCGRNGPMCCSKDRAVDGWNAQQEDQ